MPPISQTIRPGGSSCAAQRARGLYGVGPRQAKKNLYAGARVWQAVCPNPNLGLFCKENKFEKRSYVS